jgi:hypothetical protein
MRNGLLVCGETTAIKEADAKDESSKSEEG